MLLQTFLQLDEINKEAMTTYLVLVDLLHVLAGIFGLVGGLRIYNQWQLHGRHFHVDKQIVMWFGASVFTLLADQFIMQALL